jgi:beta-phosphoglucomutase
VFSKYQAFFFDFDGLLVNTEHLHYEAYRRMLLENGASFPWDFPVFASIAHKSATGLEKTITSTYPELIEAKPWALLYEEKKRWYQYLLEKGNLELMPGATEMLAQIKKTGRPYCVVTNSTKKQVELIRDHLPLLNEIPLWITREDYDSPKPSPDGYLTAIERLNVKGKKVGFEDALRGIHALQGAGIDPVLICSEQHPQMAEALKEDLLYFPSFSDLLSAQIV